MPLLKKTIWTTTNNGARIHAIWYVTALLGEAEGQRFLIRVLRQHRLAAGRSTAAFRMGYLSRPPPAIAAALRIGAKSDPDASVRKAAQKALQRLRGRKPRKR